MNMLFSANVGYGADGWPELLGAASPNVVKIEAAAQGAAPYTRGAERSSDWRLFLAHNRIEEILRIAVGRFTAAK